MKTSKLTGKWGGVTLAFWICLFVGELRPIYWGHIFFRSNLLLLQKIEAKSQSQATEPDLEVTQPDLPEELHAESMPDLESEAVQK